VYSIFIGIVVLTLYGLSWLSFKPANTFDELKSPNKIIDLIVEMDKMIISLSLLIIGAAGAIVFKKYQNIKVSSFKDGVYVLVIIISAVTAICSGYILYSKIAEMLSYGTFVARDPFIQIPLTLQFLSLLVAAAVLGFLVINIMVHKGVEDNDVIR